jgi:uncharacterized protein DUF1707
MDNGIRVSDADRDRVTAQLRDHFAAGRITPSELDERLSAALNAKTFGDLRRIMADLPGPVPAPLGAAPPPLRATPACTVRRRHPPFPPANSARAARGPADPRHRLAAGRVRQRDLAVLADAIRRRRLRLRPTAAAVAPPRWLAAPPVPRGAPLHVDMTAPQP